MVRQQTTLRHHAIGNEPYRVVFRKRRYTYPLRGAKTPIETIKEGELYYLTDANLQMLPLRDAVYVLYDTQRGILVDSGTLLNEVPVAAKRHPSATRFSVHGLKLTQRQDIEQLAQRLRQMFGLK